MGRMADLYELRVDLKLPVFFRRKQARGVAEQVYNLHQAQANYKAANQMLLFRIKEEFLRAETSSRLLKMYGETVIPQATQGLQSYLPAYEAGIVDFMSVQASFLMLVDSELAYQEELLNSCLAVARLEELTGLQLVN
jgi:outer membrane protein TolC